jgi:serine/threonine protein phosphatase PrpC
MIEWGVASRARREGVVSGDSYLVHECGDSATVGVVDGLGHGEAAAAAAAAAVDALRETAHEGLTTSLEHCHSQLRNHRGAAASVARVDYQAKRVAWLSVGNVYSVLLRPNREGLERRRAPLQAGIVGHNLPALRLADFDLRCGDVMLWATDGLSQDVGDAIASAAVRRLVVEDPVRDLAEHLLRAHCLGRDDALVLAVRYREPTS